MVLRASLVQATDAPIDLGALGAVFWSMLHVLKKLAAAAPRVCKQVDATSFPARICPSLSTVWDEKRISAVAMRSRKECLKLWGCTRVDWASMAASDLLRQGSALWAVGGA